MAQKAISRESNLEIDGNIIVKRYLRGKFKLIGSVSVKCDNCSVFYNHSHSYLLLNDEEVEICCLCNKKVHNVNASNPAFRKF